VGVIDEFLMPTLHAYRLALPRDSARVIYCSKCNQVACDWIVLLEMSKMHSIHQTFDWWNCASVFSEVECNNSIDFLPAYLDLLH